LRNTVETVTAMKTATSNALLMRGLNFLRAHMAGTMTAGAARAV